MPWGGRHDRGNRMSWVMLVRMCPVAGGGNILYEQHNSNPETI
ncbi:hypothetical protein ABIE78_001279 [Sinorhizobium fredii]